MKFLFTLLLLTLMYASTYSQTPGAPGDCTYSATEITECGWTYTGNNSTYTNNCGLIRCWPCRYPIRTNFDSSCVTSYPGGNCGSDFSGTVENSMWWYFTPVEDCDYVITVRAYNCYGGSMYMQAWIGQLNNGLITTYHVNDNNNPSMSGGNIITYTIPVTVADGDVYIMIDGYAGAICDVDITIGPSIYCTNTCPIFLSTNILEFNGELFDSRNQIQLYIESDEYSIWDLEYSLDGLFWESVGRQSVISSGTTILTWYHESQGYTYYRATNGELYTDIIAIYNPTQKHKQLLRRYTLVGQEILNIEDFNGVYVELYTDGSRLMLQK